MAAYHAVYLILCPLNSELTILLRFNYALILTYHLQNLPFNNLCATLISLLYTLEYNTDQP